MPWADLKKGRVSLNGHIYFITFNTFNRIPYFDSFSTAAKFCRQIQINENTTDAQWLTWVLMPDHFHGLVQFNNQSLNQVVSDLKGRSAFLINQHLARTGQLWQKQYFERAVRKDENIKSIARYIVANPLRKKLVDDVKSYPYWDSKYL
ncbi:REP-associated tyrosine transposase [Marinicellulosiphila megalodicopiae]|uniref:REP-associated tyrosine transposase n=1 Tax=Marinicellulosiphila megalodicopiae TaxID=2724896 RepID=UPI003BB160A2